MAGGHAALAGTGNPLDRQATDACGYYGVFIHGVEHSRQATARQGARRTNH
jgi:hypothetical protein